MEEKPSKSRKKKRSSKKVEKEEEEEEEEEGKVLVDTGEVDVEEEISQPSKQEGTLKLVPTQQYPSSLYIPPSNLSYPPSPPIITHHHPSPPPN